MHNRILFKVISLIALVLTTTELPADTIFLDGFELCRTAGVVEWDGGGDGQSWSDPLNWEGDNLPVDGDAVAIPHSGLLDGRISRPDDDAKGAGSCWPPSICCRCRS